MNIGIDVSALGEPNYTGVGVYVENLIKNLGEIDRENRYYLCYRFSRLKYRKLENPVDKPNFSLKIIQEPFNWLFQRKLDLFHGPGERLPAYGHPKKVVTIHDMAALKGGDFMTDQFREMVRKRYTELVLGGKTDLIITVSQSSRNDICEYFQCDPIRVRVVYEAASEVFAPMPAAEVERRLSAMGIHGPYILNVGAQQERKNIVRTIKAFKRYRDRGGEAKLVLSGKPTYGFERILQTISECRLEKVVTHIGHSSIEDLVALYNGALMFCLPSLFEGFGLPLVEAMACGCPVITSNVTACPEVVGDAGLVIDPLDEEAIAGAMEKLMSAEERARLRKLGFARAATFSWQRCAEETLSAYKSVL